MIMGTCQDRLCVRICSIAAVVLLASPAWLLAEPPSPAASRPARIKVTISKETTYVLGPLNRDGTVNYVAAVNEMYGRGVTADNNAAIPLLRALGPASLDAKTREFTLKALGLADLPEKGEYFIPEPPIPYSQAGPLDTAEDRLARAHLRALTQPAREKAEPELADWLKANQTPLDLLVAASTMPTAVRPSACDK